jgi:hypothetical protein
MSGIVDTGGKFATGIVDTGGKFSAGINNNWWKNCKNLREFSKI